MMRPIKKYFFRRVENAVVLADNEEDAREELKRFYTMTEDFELDNVIAGVDIDGVFVPEKQ